MDPQGLWLAYLGGEEALQARVHEARVAQVLQPHQTPHLRRRHPPPSPPTSRQPITPTLTTSPKHRPERERQGKDEAPKGEARLVSECLSVHVRYVWCACACLWWWEVWLWLWLWLCREEAAGGVDLCPRTIGHQGLAMARSAGAKASGKGGGEGGQQARGRGAGRGLGDQGHRGALSGQTG